MPCPIIPDARNVFVFALVYFYHFKIDASEFPTVFNVSSSRGARDTWPTLMGVYRFYGDVAGGLPVYQKFKHGGIHVSYWIIIEVKLG